MSVFILLYNETRRSKSPQFSFLLIVQNGLNHNSKIHIAHQFCDVQYTISLRQLSTVKPVYANTFYT